MDSSRGDGNGGYGGGLLKGSHREGELRERSNREEIIRKYVKGWASTTRTCRQLGLWLELVSCYQNS